MEQIKVIRLKEYFDKEDLIDPAKRDGYKDFLMNILDRFAEKSFSKQEVDALFGDYYKKKEEQPVVKTLNDLPPYVVNRMTSDQRYQWEEKQKNLAKMQGQGILK